MVWLTGGGLVVSLAMIIGLLTLVVVKGSATFWPQGVVRVALHDGRSFMGEVARDERYAPRPEELETLGERTGEARGRIEQEGGEAGRRMFRTGNFELTGTHYTWVSDFEVASEERPEWALVVERLSWGRFYGVPAELRIDGAATATGPAETWAAFKRMHGERTAARHEQRRIERHEIGALNRKIERARLKVREAEIEHGTGSPEHAEASRAAEDLAASLQPAFASLQTRLDELREEDARYRIALTTADGQTKELAISEIVRAYPANRLGFFGKLGVYAGRWVEFLLDEPREANSEGGVFPAIFGTVTMTILMSAAVVPLGVLAALYMREYARGGLVISAVRIAVNNLAGVPSIVFGVFGLGFFCYFVGGGIDEVFFKERLPSPTLGTGGVMWASMTLALLTLPVVIVATEEALAAVPRSMREGSYGCGASKWQTIRRIVLPRATPGIMTGMILAMARGAGEVAPLMLVGAVKLAPELPVDSVAPFVHPERSFMHLGFHIYDLGFQSQNSEAAKPMVYTTTLLLILLIASLNLAAIWLRARLSRRFRASQF